MRPKPDVDSRSRRKPRSGRGLLRGATPRRFLGGGSSRSAHTRKRARSRCTIAMLSRLFPCRTSLTAVSHRAPGPLLEPEMLRPARDQGVCDRCPMAARPRHQRCALEFRLRRLSGRGAETPEGPGLTPTQTSGFAGGCLATFMTSRRSRRFTLVILAAIMGAYGVLAYIVPPWAWSHPDLRQ